MNAVPSPADSSRPQERTDEPVYFAAGGHVLFGWLHWPAQAATAKLGMVLCKPFGFESLCGQRSLRAMADAAADAGVPALRFDYAGCGDSQNIRTGADQIEIWIRDIQAAATELRRLTGVERVCLVGTRLGALLATLAATRNNSIHSLYLFAPVVSGKRYLKELRAAQIAQDESRSVGKSPTEPAGVGPADPGACEFGGFVLSGATLASLSAIDLGKTTPPPRVTEVFIADRSDLPAAGKWSAHLSSAGVPTRYAAVKGFVEMALVAPHWAVVPLAMIQSLQEWLTNQLADIDVIARSEANTTVACQRSSVHAASPPIFISASTVLRLPGVRAGAVSMWERPVAIQSGASIFGVVTGPDHPERRRRAVILLNTGVDYHIGASRIYVALARSWALRGYHVLRMDLTGIGDSGTTPGQPPDVVYSPVALDDIRVAVEFLRAEYGATHITLAGVCSGAYHSLRAAAADLSINQIMMVNPLTYFWQPGSSLDGLQLAEIVRNPGVYRERMVSAKAWERLLTGKVNIWRIIRIYMQRPLLSLRSRWRDLVRALGVRMTMDLGRELQQIAARGVGIVFVFARGEAGLNLLHIEAGSSLRKLGARCRIRIIDNGDHTFTQHTARTILERVLGEELLSPPAKPDRTS